MGHGRDLRAHHLAEVLIDRDGRHRHQGHDDDVFGHALAACRFKLRRISVLRHCVGIHSVGGARTPDHSRMPRRTKPARSP